MRTPAQHATEIVEVLCERIGPVFQTSPICKLIADAIRESIMQERAECAAKAERATRNWPDNETIRCVLRGLAEDIREGR